VEKNNKIRHKKTVFIGIFRLLQMAINKIYMEEKKNEIN